MANTDPVDSQLRALASGLTVTASALLSALKSRAEDLHPHVLQLEVRAGEAVDLARQIHDGDLDEPQHEQMAGPLLIGAGLALLLAGATSLLAEGLPTELMRGIAEPAAKSRTSRSRK